MPFLSLAVDRWPMVPVAVRLCGLPSGNETDARAPPQRRPKATSGRQLSDHQPSIACRGGEPMAVAVKSREAVERDIRETFGLVPSFFSRMPTELLEHEWELMKQ